MLTRMLLEYKIVRYMLAPVFLTLVSVYSGSALFIGCNCGEMLPDDPYFFFNETIQINCSLHQPGIQNISELTISKSNKVLKTDIIDDRTIVFHKTAEPGDEGMYDCYLNRAMKDDLVASQKLTLEYAPPALTAEDLKCIVFNFGEKMECSWQLPFITMENIDVKLYWQYGRNYSLCVAEKNKCEWTTGIGLSLPWQFHIEITNTEREITKISHITKKMKYFVKPNKVTFFNSSPTNTSGYCLTLRWTFDKSYDLRPQTAGISYYSEHSKEMIKLNASVNVEKYTSCGFIPNTQYTFTIRAIPATHGGYWSDPVSINSNTNEDVPTVAPTILSGFYSSSPDTCNNMDDIHNIEIYWQKIPLLERNGNIRKYNIKYTTADESEYKKIVIKKSDATSATLKLKCGSAYRVSVNAATKKGFANKASSILIPRRRGTDWNPPKFVVEKYSGSDQSTKFNVSWSVYSGIDPSTITSFTVQYCIKGLDSCDGEIQYKRVDGSTRWLVLNNLIKDYWIGVTMENNEFSSGVTFTDCVYSKNAGPPTPKNVVVKSVIDDSLTVEWNTIPCDGYNPYVVKYTIHWCEIVDNVCSGAMKRDTVYSNESSMSYELTDLKRDQLYGVQVSAHSSSGESSPSDMIKKTPKNSALDKGTIAGYCVLGVFLFCLCVAGCISVVRCTKQKYKNYNEEYQFDFPEMVKSANHSDKKDSCMSSNKDETTGLMAETDRQNSVDSAFESLPCNEATEPQSVAPVKQHVPDCSDNSGEMTSYVINDPVVFNETSEPIQTDGTSNTEPVSHDISFVSNHDLRGETSEPVQMASNDTNNTEPIPHEVRFLSNHELRIQSETSKPIQTASNGTSNTELTPNEDTFLSNHDLRTPDLHVLLETSASGDDPYVTEAALAASLNSNVQTYSEENQSVMIKSGLPDTNSMTVNGYVRVAT